MRKILIFSFILLTGVFFIWLLSYAYEPIPTHSALAEKSARLFNQYYGNLSDEEISEIIQVAGTKNNS
jgi:hypothetical protein